MAAQFSFLLVGGAYGLFLKLFDTGHVEGNLHAGARVYLAFEDAAHSDKVAVGEALIHLFRDTERNFFL